MANDPFVVLGVSPSATEDEIKSAYRKLAKKYHPDLNPGDKAAEQKMREVNEAYTEAMQIRKGGAYRPSGSSGSGFSGAYDRYSPNGSGYQQNPYGRSDGYRTAEQERYRQDPSGNPFGSFGFDPFAAFFGGQQTGYNSDYRSARTYTDPDLRTVAEFIRSRQYEDALQLLNRIPRHDADWHALYAQADMALGNRISALDHARTAVRMAPQDPDYQRLLNLIESGSETYRQTRTHNGYDFRSMICANPCLTCFAANIALNCCLGGFGRFFCC